MSSLFDWQQAYPVIPGSKGHHGTSEAAAEAIKPDAGILREKTLRAIRSARDGLTADQVAEFLGESILSIRPRCSELKLYGHIKDSGQRRRNDSGKNAVVWVAV